MNNLIKVPEKRVDEEPMNETAFEVEEEKQIIVHCKCDSRGSDDSYIRIWKTTFLIDQASEYKRDLFIPDNTILIRQIPPGSPFPKGVNFKF